jgi:hypothetical protein
MLETLQTASSTAHVMWPTLIYTTVCSIPAGMWEEKARKAVLRMDIPALLLRVAYVRITIRRRGIF